MRGHTDTRVFWVSARRRTARVHCLDIISQGHVRSEKHHCAQCYLEPFTCCNQILAETCNIQPTHTALPHIPYVGYIVYVMQSYDTFTYVSRFAVQCAYHLQYDTCFRRTFQITVVSLPPRRLPPSGYHPARRGDMFTNMCLVWFTELPPSTR